MDKKLLNLETGKYYLFTDVECISSGKNTAVFRGRLGEQPVVLKRPAPGASRKKTEDFIKLYKKHLNLSGRHPETISWPMGLFEDENVPYIVVKGNTSQTLETFFQEETSIFRRLRVIREVCAVVNSLHEENLLLLDIKPANFLYVDSPGVTRVELFDLDSIIPVPQEWESTGDYVISGTRSYAPAELRAALDGESADIGIWCDVAGIGALIYEAIYGEPPFTSGSEINDKPGKKYDLSHLEGISAQCVNILETILRKTLSSDIDDRYHSLKELMAYLDKLLPELDPELEKLKEKERLRRRVRYRRISINAVGFLALLLAAIFGVYRYYNPIVYIQLRIYPYVGARAENLDRDFAVITERLERLNAKDIQNQNGELSARVRATDSLWHNKDISTVVMSLITGRGELRLFDSANYGDDRKELSINSSDIESIKSMSMLEANQKYNIPLYVEDVSGYRKSLSSAQACILLDLEPGVLDWLSGLDARAVELCMEIGPFDALYFVAVFISDDGKSLVAVLPEEYGLEMADALSDIIMGEKLLEEYSKSYTIIPEYLPVRLGTRGEYQVDENQQGENWVNLFFEGYEDFSDEEFQNNLINIQARLDFIEQPYFIGRASTMDNQLFVSIDPSGFSSSISELIGGVAPEIESWPYTEYGYMEIASVSIIERSGYLALAVGVEDPEMLQTATEHMTAVPGAELRLAYSDGILSCDVQEPIYNGIIVFDKLYAAGLEHISEEYLYILKLIKYNIENNTFDNLSLRRTLFPAGNGYGMSSITEDEKALVKEIEKNFPGVTSYLENESGKRLVIKLNLPADENLPKTGIDMAIRIFDAAQLDTQKLDYVLIQLTAESDTELCRLIFSWPLFDYSTKMFCEGAVAGEYFDSYYDEIEALSDNAFFEGRDFSMYKISLRK